MWSRAYVLLSNEASSEGLSGSAFTRDEAYAFKLGSDHIPNRLKCRLVVRHPHGPASFVRQDHADPCYVSCRLNIQPVALAAIFASIT